MNELQTHLKPSLHWKNILVPVDFSEPSKHAIKIAADLAEQSGAGLTLLHVVQLPVSYTVDALPGVGEIINTERDTLERLSQEIPPGLVQQKLIQFTKQGILQDIIEVAQDLPADLMIITTHGYRGLKRIWHGCMAEEIICHAPCPVLVVPPAENTSG
jgi:nucleotide-binding universal stress UspA family protein